MQRVARGDSRYPSALLALSDPPDVLWVEGTLPALPMVAVVGTRAPDREGRRFARDLGEALARAPDREGRRFARDLGEALARAGVAVVSGGALGIDAAAHQGALDAGRPTVAVLGTGIDVAYPPEHRGLFERIALDGAVVSELAPGSPPRREHFPQRNRIVAVLGAATVVVQAGRASGALSTAAVARRLGRPVVAVPWSPYDPRGEGSAILLRAGATFAGSLADVLRAVGLGPVPVRGTRRRRAVPAQGTVDPVERAILAALDGGPLYQAEIVEETGLASEEVVRAILSLVLSGRIEEIDFQRFGHAPPSRR